MATNNTFVKIETVTVSSGGTTNIVFSSIPQTYSDLKIVISGRNADTGTSNALIYLNGDGTASNYYSVMARDNGGTLAWTQYSGNVGYINMLLVNGSDTTGNTFGNSETIIGNYSSSSSYKTISTMGAAETAGTGVMLSLVAGVWRVNTAVTSITLGASVAPFSQYTTATLYGIARTSASAKATGGLITTDGTYFYHTFLASDTFTPSQSLSADYLVVAGGGGSGQTSGGGWCGGPGGAGGYRYLTSQSFTATSYAITVGAGGAAGAYSAGGGNYGANGGSSSIIGGAISTSASGGGGGGTTGTNGKIRTTGKNGGSGGGAPQDTASVAGGSGNSGGYSPVEGYAGGSVNGSSPYVPGLGGGSSGAGTQTDAVTTNYTSNSINGTATNYARGGYRGGLAGDSNAPAYTGNGGNGNQTGSSGNNDSPGWNGGSGIVIIRYAV